MNCLPLSIFYIEINLCCITGVNERNAWIVCRTAFPVLRLICVTLLLWKNAMHEMFAAQFFPCWDYLCCITGVNERSGLIVCCADFPMLRLICVALFWVNGHNGWIVCRATFLRLICAAAYCQAGGAGLHRLSPHPDEPRLRHSWSQVLWARP